MARTTISEVAAAAGVSIATASKALNGTASIAPDTVRRVTKAAEKLGYKPNRAAQLLAGKNKNIGILMPGEPEPVFSLFEAGLSASLAEYEEYGFRSQIIRYNPANTAKEFPIGLAKLREHMHGLIFIGGKGMPEDELRRLPIPKVSLQVAADESLCPSVTVDERGVGRIAADFLSLTCKTAAVIVGDGSVSIHQRNVEGFREEASRRGLAVTAVLESFDRLDLARDAAKQLIRTAKPDGIFVSSYVAPAVCACLAEHGLAGKIRVIGVDIWQKSAECLRDGSLTAAIYQNQQLQASRAVDMIVSLMRGCVLTESVQIKPELVLESGLKYYI